MVFKKVWIGGGGWGELYLVFRRIFEICSQPLVAVLSTPRVTPRSALCPGRTTSPCSCGTPPLTCSALYYQGDAPERLVSGSDDFTLFLWHPEVDKKSIARLTGHQQLINEVKFSPDTRLLASASFDKSVKLWDGKTGKYETLI